jgi:hypothetical protein
MSKIIELIHPYQLKGIKNINDYLLVLKNVSRILEKHGYREKMDGILVPVRWSIAKKDWVLDRGTLLDRDKNGLTLSEISNSEIANELKIAARYVLSAFLNNKKLDELAETLGMKKNENRFFSFEHINFLTNRIRYENTTAYPIGIFSMNRNKKSDIIDISEKMSKNIVACSNKFTEIKNLKSNKNYIFEKFFDSILKETITLSISDNFKCYKVKDIISDNSILFKSKIKIKGKKYHYNSVGLYQEIFKNGCSYSVFEKIKASIFIMYLNELYGNFIKSTILDLKNSEGVVVYDKKNNVLYKITGNFYYSTTSVINKQIKKEDNNNFKPLLPGVF